MAQLFVAGIGETAERVDEKAKVNENDQRVCDDQRGLLR